MAGSPEEYGARRGHQGSWIWVFVAFAAMAILLLWEEHRAHVLGVIPYLILFACPLMHLLHRHGHRHGGHRQERHHA